MPVRSQFDGMYEIAVHADVDNAVTSNGRQFLTQLFFRHVAGQVLIEQQGKRGHQFLRFHSAVPMHVATF